MATNTPLAAPLAARRPKVNLSTLDHLPRPPEGYAERMLAKAPPTEDDLLYRSLVEHDDRAKWIDLYLAKRTELDRIEAKLGTLPDDETSIGSLTFGTLPDTPIPPQLAPPFLAPNGATILYGPGGVGKGMTAVALGKRLIDAGMPIMVVDYENNPNEWGRRARAMGYTAENLAMAHYRAPFGNDWTAQRGSLAEVAHLIGEDCAQRGVKYLIVDSYTTATSTGDSMGGKDAAQEFYEGLRIIGLPSLTLAHVAGNGARFPDKPFGSIFVHNLARETWACESIANDDAWVDPSTRDLQPQVMKLELRNKKKNEGAAPAHQFLTFEFHINDTIDVTFGEAARPRLADRVTDILRRAGIALAAKDIIKGLKDEYGDSITDNHLRSMFSKHRERFTASDTFPQKWSLAEPS